GAKSLRLLPSGPDRVGDNSVRPTPAAHMGDSALSGKIGEVPGRIHLLVKNPQHNNVPLLRPEIEVVMLRLEPTDNRAEVYRPSAERVGKESLSGRTQLSRVAIRLRRAPFGIGVIPDFLQVRDCRVGEPQAARDFLLSRAWAIISSKVKSLMPPLSPSAMSSRSRPRPSSESMRIRWRKQSLALAK